MGEDPVELAFAEIQCVVRAGSLAIALNVGEIVFRHLYRGDVDLLRDNGKKDVSFRRLADHGGLQMSRAKLWQSVAIFELSLRLPEIKASKHLGVTHVRAVLGLPARAQERLLARAERECLDAKALETQAASARKGHGGRPMKPAISRALDGLRRVANMPLETFADPRALKKLSQEELECAVATLHELDERLKVLRGTLRAAGALR
ncbi:MAG: hypothetical protein IPI67_26705 [Myxococcales bacterium]|nr:hypothetical protein [Myxococcales bacterium]